MTGWQITILGDLLRFINEQLKRSLQQRLRRNKYRSQQPRPDEEEEEEEEKKEEEEKEVVFLFM